jgi:hypothetical protein
MKFAPCHAPSDRVRFPGDRRPYIMHARERGHLGQTRPGKKGELGG